MNLENYLVEKYSKNCVRGYLNQIKRFKLALGERAEQSNQRDILQYIGLLRGQKLHPKSLRNNLFAIKIYFNYLQETGQINYHPCRYLVLKDRIDRQIQVDNLYPKEILNELYENYQSTNPKDQERNKVIISLLINQALTVLELISLRIKDIDLEDGLIKVKSTRQNRGRNLSLKPNQILQIHHYINQRKGEEYLLENELGNPIWSGSINRIINQGRNKENKLTALKIRQSVITHLLKENNNTRLVQEFAGHRRISSTEAYKQSGLEELKSSIEKLHPLG